MKKLKVDSKNIWVAEYSSRAYAFAAMSRAKGQGVMLGDNGRYWLCRLSDCQRLERVGYEWAK